MVGSGTWYKKDRVEDQSTWFVFAFGFLSIGGYSLTALAQIPTTNTFFVSTSVPYKLPHQKDASAQSLSAVQIGQLAAARCGAANMVAADSKSRSLHSFSVCNKDVDCEKEVLRSFQVAIAYRLRQTASANAMKIHFGIAACLTAERIFNETEELIRQQVQAQDQLIEKGIPIPDPLLVGRLKINLDDKRLENQSKIAILRSQLSSFIGTENACPHMPNEEDEIVPSDWDVCERTQQALGCRCDLLTMNRLRGAINAETLTVWDGIGAILSGVPSVAKPIPFWSKLLRKQRNQNENERAIAARRKWLDNLIAERTKQISLEVDIAFEKKKTAAMRWVKATEQIANWNTRIVQLEKLSEVQGNLASQFESKLNRLLVYGQRTERWVEWHQAHIDLLLAIGCDL